MSGPYSRTAQPPFPALSIQLRSQASDQNTGLLVAWVDTGADATLIPMRHLIEIGAEETATGWLRGITGERLLVGLFFVDILVGDLTLPGVRVVGTPAVDESLLGRDVLNRLALLLDGPARHTTVLDDATAERLRGRR